MAHELTWSPAARLDLKEIFAYIAEDDPRAGKNSSEVYSWLLNVFRCSRNQVVSSRNSRTQPLERSFTDRVVLYTESKPVKTWLRSLEFGMRREEYPNYEGRDWGQKPFAIHLTRGIKGGP